MAVLIKKKGPIGAIFFYPDEVVDKAILKGIVTKDYVLKRKIFAMILMALGVFFIPYYMIIYVNEASSFLEYFYEFFIIFVGMSTFSWYFIDTLWVASSNWWIIPELSDLEYLWHDRNVQRFKFLRGIIKGVIFGLLFACICLLISKI